MTRTSVVLPMSPEVVQQVVDRFPRLSLAQLPTPLDEAKRLSHTLGGPRIFIKRDDLTGLGLGGNKPRKMDFVMADALAHGADCIVTTAAAQSNMVRVICAAGAKLGLEVYAVLRGDREEVQGSLLLDYLFGAKITFINTKDPYSRLSIDTMNAIIPDLEAKGRKPYIIDMRYQTGPLAAVAYVAATLELQRQLAEQGIRPTHLFVSLGSGTTQAGILVGKVLLGLPYKVIGVSVQRPKAEMLPRITKKIVDITELIGVPVVVPEEQILIEDSFIGEAYGVPSPAGTEAMKLLARTEGIIVDPVYTNKGFSGLVGWIREGKLTRDDTVVFVHTGGIPALFAHSRELAEAVQAA